MRQATRYRHENAGLWEMWVRAVGGMLTIMLAAAAVATPATARDPIVIKGSDTMVNLNRELTERYAKRHRDIEFDVEGRGSGTGIKALLEGKTDIAAASRAMTPEEVKAFKDKTGREPEVLVVALDGIGIYTHNNNPVSRLTLTQLEAIFCGEIKNWKEVGGLNRSIHIYNRNKDSGTRAFMREHVMKGKPFSNRAMEVSSTAVLAAAVSRNQSGIGYGGIAYAEGAHIIRLARNQDEPGIWPSKENITSGDYPLSRPLYFYLNPTSLDKEVRGFVDWVKSPEGQKTVSFVGFFPAPDTKPASPEPIEDLPPVVNKEPTLITPENMGQHGFDLEVTLDPGATKRAIGATPVTLTLMFASEGHSIDRIESITVRLGGGIEFPLTLDDDLTASFTIGRSMIRHATLYLAESGAPDDGAMFIIALGEFCKDR